jgi:hypothetical protein
MNVDDGDVGEPIAEIASLDVQPAPGFRARVRNRIQRRILGTQVVDFGWSTPRLLLLEFLEMLFRVFRGQGADKGDSS